MFVLSFVNVLAAISIGLAFEVPVEKIITAIENYTPTNSRSQLIEWKNNKVILDAYNANPSSMQLAIENFIKISHFWTIVIRSFENTLGEVPVKKHFKFLHIRNSVTFRQILIPDILRSTSITSRSTFKASKYSLLE
jgi:UDP-N-acetylmuramoyl-tripeptide--D-alanyl-D-alanine ligase